MSDDPRVHTEFGIEWPGVDGVEVRPSRESAEKSLAYFPGRLVQRTVTDWRSVE